jgi:hypothetical protein
MNLSLLLLATPIYGLSLSFDPSVLALPAAVPLLLDAEGAAAVSDTAEAPAEAPAPDEVARLMERRDRIGRIHRAFGIATWSSMTLTVIFGMIQDWNLYGFFASQGNTPCVRGDAVFGQDACLGTPIPHLVTAAATGALYFTTFSLSFAMPDPMHLDEGNSGAARRLRTHKRLRWAHLSGMAAQILLGIVLANNDAFGLDRANHYNGLRALSAVHLATGLATYATLTWAGALEIRR